MISVCSMRMSVCSFLSLTASPKVMGTLLKVTCEVKWQSWRWSCGFDLVSDGGLSAPLDSRPPAFGFLPLHIFSPVYLVICMDGVPQDGDRTDISLSPLHQLLFVFSVCHTRRRTNHVG